MSKVVFILDQQNEARQGEPDCPEMFGFQVEKFEDPALFLKQFDEVRDTDTSPFCIIINGAELSCRIRVFLENIDTRQCGLPVLVVDHEQFNLRRQDYCRTLSVKFPLFVCQKGEVAEFVKSFKVLGNRVRTFNFRTPPNFGDVRQRIR